MDTLTIGSLLACYRLGLIQDKKKLWLLKNSLWISIIGIILIIVLLSEQYDYNLIKGYAMFAIPRGYLNNIFTAQIFLFVALLAAWSITRCISIYYIDRGGYFKMVYLYILGKYHTDYTFIIGQ